MPVAPVPASINDNQKAVEITRQAHLAEHAGDYKQAYDLHCQASNLLVKVVLHGKKKSEERRRAKLQLRAANDRQDALRACIEGTSRPPEPLPSLATVEREIRSPLAGTVLLTLVEMGRYPTLSALPGLLQQQQTPSQEASNPPLLMELLSPSLPDVTYHVYVERFTRFPKFWVYLHIKDADKKQTLYTVSTLKKPKYQIPACVMARAAEYDATCASITVTPVRPRQSKAETAQIGRPFTIITGTQTVIRDAPDRLEKQWTPRRFTYGGRRFVWKEGRGLMNSVETLHEVRRERPNPESKTGKILDETHSRPLVWGESKFSMHKVCTIHMVGGLDQMFREFLLANLVTRLLIGLYGH